jgi:hypothetical protein
MTLSFPIRSNNLFDYFRKEKTMKTKKLLSVLAVLVLLLAALPVLSVGAGGIKVDVCHNEGNGTYHLINISDNAFDSHVAHGDASPGEAVPGMTGFEFDEACNVVQALQTTTVTSAALNLSSTGAGGWSCPSAYPQVLSAYLQQAGQPGVDPAYPADLYLWVPGASAGGATYPNTPFGYTYGTGETGAIVLNGGTGQSLQIVLTCQETP